ncbi:aspartic-type endopeptidase [Desmophyllum pertusum]|uniref:Aspartic-type endopeptidase n=1 Tax=Desmophyllum pertusum TaxID=174260 RepID=A0A9W9YH11_9CNID|nr:aspartic-type endopeptidase [Desmophyllum pertusum]
MISGPQSLAAYQSNAPSGSNYNRDNEDNEVARLKEEIHQLKASLRESQPPKGGQTYSYVRNRAHQEVNSDLSYALEDIRRMQSRMDGFMRTYASRNSRQDQRVQIRDYRPTCDSCGKAGHVIQHCFHRFQQSPNHSQPQTSQELLPMSTFKKPPRAISHPMITPTLLDEACQYPPAPQPTNDNQEIVVRIEICSGNKTSDSKNVTLMPNVTEENLGKEKSKLPVSATVKLNNDLTAKVKLREDNTRIKYLFNQQTQLFRCRKQPHRENDQPSTKTPTSPIIPLNEEPARNAFVTAKLLGYPVDLLESWLISGACISVIDAEFLREVFANDKSTIVPSTYSQVYTVSGEKLPTIGKVEVNLSFNGRKFPFQFHVIENMIHNAVIGRDFLLSHHAIINFADGTLKLDNIHPIDLSMKAI